MSATGDFNLSYESLTSKAMKDYIFKLRREDPDHYLKLSDHHTTPPVPSAEDPDETPESSSDVASYNGVDNDLLLADELELISDPSKKADLGASGVTNAKQSKPRKSKRKS